MRQGPPEIRDHQPRVPHLRPVSPLHALQKSWQFRPGLLLWLLPRGRSREWVWPLKWPTLSCLEDVGYATIWGFQAPTGIRRRFALGTHSRAISNAMSTPDVWQR
jgi:hypothetical protein